MSTHKKSAVTSKLGACIEDVLEGYFSDLDGHKPSRDLYDMVMAEVEMPLLRTILRFTGGNQSRAAEILGINRSTLRKKLAKFGLG